MSKVPLIFLIAGEASGDQLGADLMISLKAKREVRFVGIGGEAMKAQGLESLFPMKELSLMGVFSILRNLRHLLGRLTYTVETIQALKPDVVVTIDVPEFSFRVMKRLHKSPERPRLIHYVAPTVWAWRPGRAQKISRFLDRLLCLYPFEAPYFEKHGLKTTFVGHPVANDSGLPRHHVGNELSNCSKENDEFLRNKCSPGLLRSARSDGSGVVEKKEAVVAPLSAKIVIASGEKQSKEAKEREKNLLCVLPGSRCSEIQSLLPIFKNTVSLLQKDIPDLKVILPTLPSVETLVREGVKAWPLNVQIVVGDKARNKAFGKATAALAASGTVALQLSATGLPFVICYKMGTLSAWIAHRLIKTPWACMVNILLAFQKFGPTFVLNQKAKELIPDPWIPEFIQEECKTEKIAPALLKLLKDKKAQESQNKAMKETILLLKAPYDAVASAVIEEIGWLPSTYQ